MENPITTQKTVPDSITEIAVMVRQDWKNIYFGAKPYLNAMMELNSIYDHYYEDSADMIISYFLANATTWRGETARQVKAKLNYLIAQVRNTSNTKIH